MAGNIYNIEKLTFSQIDALDREKTAFLIAVSPLEEHGPHLPIGVDAFHADLFARQAADIIIREHPEFDAVLFPLIPLGTQVYKHIGSFYIKPSTLYDIVYNTGRGIAIYNFKHIFVFSAHGTPKQIVAVEAACRKISKKHGVSMLSLTGALAAKFLGGEMYSEIAESLGRNFTDEEKHLLKYDFHAGWWETSMMLKYFPELVDKSYKELKPYLKNLITRKVITPEIKPQGYLGSPAKADPYFAETSMNVFAGIAAQLIKRCLNGEDITCETTSPYYKYPHFHPFFKKNLTIGIITTVFLAMIVFIIKLLA